MDDTAQAIKDLKALLKLHSLKIITAEANFGRNVPSPDPAAYVQHAVVKLEGPDQHGLMVAHSAEGDYCVGMPEVLLERLQEWRR